MTYKQIISIEDCDIAYLTSILKSSEIACYLSINESKYWNYVIKEPNAYFFKVYNENTLIGAIHLEKDEKLLYMDILIFPYFQRMGFATRVIKDIQNDIFGLNYDRIEISIDESNIASLKLFENAGFTFVSKEDELLNFVYEKDRQL